MGEDDMRIAAIAALLAAMGLATSAGAAAELKGKDAYGNWQSDPPDQARGPAAARRHAVHGQRLTRGAAA
jgi:hypothetical protein